MEAARDDMDTWRTYALDEIVDLGSRWCIYRGRDVTSGKTVLVHLVAPGVPSEQSASIAKELRNRFLNTPDLRDVLLEFGQSQGIHGLITEYVAPALKATKEYVPSAPAVEKAEAGRPGEFTQMFTPEDPSLTGAIPPANETKPAQVDSEPSEFTRRFFTVPTANPSEATAESRAPVLDSLKRAAPGDFTQIFQAHDLNGQHLMSEVANKASSKRAPRADVSDPDEFNRFHREPAFESAVPLKLPLLQQKAEPKDPLHDWLQMNPVAPPTSLSNNNSIFDTPPPPLLPAVPGPKAPSESSGFIPRLSTDQIPPPVAAPAFAKAPEPIAAVQQMKAPVRLWMILLIIGVVAILVVISALVLAKASNKPASRSQTQRSSLTTITALPVTG